MSERARCASLRCGPATTLLLAVVAATPTWPGTGAFAAELPGKPLRMIVPYPAGGGADTIARLLVARLPSTHAERAIVENRPGAAGIIGGEAVARSAPDGQTWMIVVASHAINAASGRKLPYDTERDFSPASLVGWGPNVVAVHPALPVRSVRDLLALARARPGSLQFASFGAGSVSHLSGELFNQVAGVELTHVAYRGAAPAMADVVGGHVPLAFGSLAATMGYVRDGKLRALAVTSPARSPLAPELPTLAESGVGGFDTREWWGVFGPAGVPAEVTARFSNDLAQAVAAPAVRDRLMSIGAEPIGSEPARLASFLAAEIARWRTIIKAGKIAME